MSTSVYKESLKRLNTEQRQAVETIEGTVLVVAGPGTGKTQILTTRIAHILQTTDTNPSSILALTFTEAGVRAMRERLQQMIGEAAREVMIFTYHGFTGWLHKEYPEKFVDWQGRAIISDEDQVALLQSLLAQPKWQEIVTYSDRFFYVGAIRSTISALKREGISPADYSELMNKEENQLRNDPNNTHQSGRYAGRIKGDVERVLAKMIRSHELTSIYSEYEETLKETGQMDYDDMILSVVTALESDEEFKMTVQERFLYLLADEHQDANGAQQRILECLSDYEQPNLFVVGDEKQAIFRFQGARGGNFARLVNVHPEATVISLTKNYRSQEGVLKAAQAVGDNMELQTTDGLILHTPLTAGASDVSEAVPFTTHQVQDEAHEARAIVELVQEKVSAGANLEDVAILYRNNNQGQLITAALQVAGVDYTINADQNIFDSPVTKLLMSALAVARDPHDDVALATLFMSSAVSDLYDLSASVSISLTRKLKRSKKSLYEIVDDASNFSRKTDAKRYQSLLENIAKWHASFVNNEMESLLRSVVIETGLVKMASENAVASQVLPVLQLFNRKYLDLVERHRVATTIHDRLLTMSEQGILLRAPDVEHQKGVHVMTAHRSKGLEFPIVIVAGTVEGRWLRRARPQYFWLPDMAQNEATENDERKLFYVAITRAAGEVHLFVPERSLAGSSYEPLRFIEEVRSGVDVVVETPQENESVALSAWQVPIALPLAVSDAGELEQFASEALQKDGLSVSSLNQWLDCPRAWFYRYVVRLPEPVHPKAELGSLMHDVLDYIYRERNSDPKVNLGMLPTAIAHAFTKRDIDESKQGYLHDEMSKILEGYLDTHLESVTHPVETEVHVQHWQEIAGMYLRLSGFIDLVEPTVDNKVEITDYKTTEPKSKGVVVGSTKNSNGNYARQLCFYGYLLQQVRGVEVTTGTISFLLPDKKGQYKDVSIPIDNDQCQSVLEEAERMVKDLQHGGWLEEKCDNKQCSYCAG